MNATRDQRWILRSRGLLDQSARQLDPDTLRRLNQIRWKVLKSQQRTGLPPAVRWAGAAAAAIVLAAVVAVAQFGLPRRAAPDAASTVPPPPEPIAVDEAPAPRRADPFEQMLTLPASDLELLQQESDYALLEELEFYAWLEAAGNEG